MSSVERPPLNEAEVDRNPFQQFRVWLDQAAAAGLYQHDAMVLATATSAGAPTARVVLLRGLDERGFAFYTNYDSRKGDELEANPLAALLFYWPELERQVRIEGRVERTSAEESDRYFASRPYDSCLGAWASPQSQVIANRGCWNGAWTNCAGSMETVPYRVRPIGAAIGCCRRPSSSGRAVPVGCTTACAICVRRMAPG